METLLPIVKTYSFNYVDGNGTAFTVALVHVSAMKDPLGQDFWSYELAMRV